MVSPGTGAAAGQTAMVVRVSATALRDAAELSLPHAPIHDDDFGDDEAADIMVEMYEDAVEVYGEDDGLVRAVAGSCTPET